MSDYNFDQVSTAVLKGIWYTGSLQRDAEKAIEGRDPQVWNRGLLNLLTNENANHFEYIRDERFDKDYPIVDELDDGSDDLGEDFFDETQPLNFASVSGEVKLADRVQEVVARSLLNLGIGKNLEEALESGAATAIIEALDEKATLGDIRAAICTELGVSAPDKAHDPSAQTHEKTLGVE